MFRQVAEKEKAMHGVVVAVGAVGAKEGETTEAEDIQSLGLGDFWSDWIDRSRWRGMRR